jgi:hypothetical protein
MPDNFWDLLHRTAAPETNSAKAETFRRRVRIGNKNTRAVIIITVHAYRRGYASTVDHDR